MEKSELTLEQAELLESMVLDMSNKAEAACGFRGKGIISNIRDFRIMISQVADKALFVLEKLDEFGVPPASNKIYMWGIIEKGEEE